MCRFPPLRSVSRRIITDRAAGAKAVQVSPYQDQVLMGSRQRLAHPSGPGAVCSGHQISDQADLHTVVLDARRGQSVCVVVMLARGAVLFMGGIPMPRSYDQPPT